MSCSFSRNQSKFPYFLQSPLKSPTMKATKDYSWTSLASLMATFAFGHNHIHSLILPYLICAATKLFRSLFRSVSSYCYFDIPQTGSFTTNGSTVQPGSIAAALPTHQPRVPSDRVDRTNIPSDTASDRIRAEHAGGQHVADIVSGCLLTWSSGMLTWGSSLTMTMMALFLSKTTGTWLTKATASQVDTIWTIHSVNLFNWRALKPNNAVVFAPD